MIWERCPNSLFCMWISSSPCSICWKDYFSSLNYLGTLVKNQFTINLWFYFLSTLLIYMSLFMPVVYYLDYCRFLLSFEFRKYGSSNIVLFKTVWVILSLLNFHFVNFSISLSISVRKPVGILLGLALNL